MDGPLVMHRPISHIKNFSGKHFSGLFINNSGVLKRNMKKIYLSFYSTWDIYNFALLFTPSFIFTKYFIWTIQTVIGTITDPLDRYANLLVIFASERIFIAHKIRCGEPPKQQEVQQLLHFGQLSHWAHILLNTKWLSVYSLLIYTR